MTFKRYLIYIFLQILPLLYMGCIWYLSGRPSDAVIVLGFYDAMIKESLHLVEFAILYGLVVLALLARSELSPAGTRLAVMISVVYAFVDEFHQFFIPSRSASLVDLLKDTLGIAVACGNCGRGSCKVKRSIGLVRKPAVIWPAGGCYPVQGTGQRLILGH